MSKPALGRGLGALLTGPLPAATVGSAPAGGSAPLASPEADAGERVRLIPLSRIRPCTFQPRKDFPPETLRELADSIREQGILQPLVVRRAGEDWELIAGERRLRAAQLVGLQEVPVVVREADDRAALSLALIENLQREDLNPLEEAEGYARLVEQFQLRQEDVAARVGKSRAAVANALRLLKLPTPVQNLIREGRLSVGHAKVILGLPTEKQQKKAAERVVKHGLSVRQTEQLVAPMLAAAQPSAPSPAPTAATTPPAGDPHLADLENRLRERLGTRVRVHYRNGAGTLEITFFSDEELERILHLLGVGPE